MMSDDRTDETLWSERAVRCVIVPGSGETAVELRNEQGVPFLRKKAPTLTAARNEGEYLRLVLNRDTSPPGGGGLKPFALIVEDEIDTADAYREALRVSGVRALSAQTGREAIRLASELLPDLMILDYRLPDMHGAEVCRKMRANPATAAIPILVVTASPQDTFDDQCPDAVLTKPCLLPTLLAASRLLLQRVMPSTHRRQVAS
jgi:CheY-like chemotaxis protein